MRHRKIYPGREDGGPSTRSKTAQENSKNKASYADILKSQAPNEIKNAQTTYIHEIKISLIHNNKPNQLKNKKLEKQQRKEVEKTFTS